MKAILKYTVAAAAVLLAVCAASCNFAGLLPEENTGAVRITLSTDGTEQATAPQSATLSSRCVTPAVPEGVSYTYTLYSGETESATGTLTLASGAATISSIKYGTYTLQVIASYTSGTNTYTVLSGTSDSFTVSSDNLSPAVSVNLAWETTGTTNGTATLTVTVTSVYELDSTKTVTATFTPAGTSGAVDTTSTTTIGSTDSSTTSSATTATKKIFATTDTTDTTDTTSKITFERTTDTKKYEYTITGSGLSLAPGTYNLSLTYGTTELLNGEDTSVLIAPGMETTLTYAETMGYKNVYVNSSSTATTATGTLAAPYATIAAAFSGTAASATEPVQINILGSYTVTETTDTPITNGTSPVLVNLRGNTLLFTGTATVLVFTKGTGTVTFANGTIAGSATSKYGIISYAQVLYFENCTVSSISDDSSSGIICSNSDIHLVNTTVTGATTGVNTQLLIGAAKDTTTSTATSPTVYFEGTSTVTNGFTGLDGALVDGSKSTITTANTTISYLGLEALDSLYTGTAVFASSYSSPSVTQWPLVGSGVAYSGTTVLPVAQGFLYSGAPSAPSTNSSISTSSSSILVAASFATDGTATAATEQTGFSYFDTAFDDNGLCYRLTYDSSEMKLYTQIGSSTISGINSSPFTLAVDRADNAIIVAVNTSSTSDEKTTYTATLYLLTGYDGSTFTPTVITPTVTVSDGSTTSTFWSGKAAYIKKIAYDSTNKYLFIVDSENQLHRYNAAITIPTDAPTTGTIALTSGVSTTTSPVVTAGLSTPFTDPDSSTSNTITTQITDMALYNGELYVLGATNTTYFQEASYIVNRGVLMAIDPAFTLTDGAIQTDSFTYYGTITAATDETSYIWTPTTSNETSYFYGAQRILAIMEKKLVIADDGCWVDTTNSCFKLRKRTMLFDTTATTLAVTAGKNIDSYSLSYSPTVNSDVSTWKLDTN